MPTYTALTTLPGRQPAEALGEALEQLDPEGVGVFEIEDGSGLWEVGGYFSELPDVAALELLAKAFGSKSFAISELPEKDWVAHVQRELKPIEAGRFFLYGSHDADKVPEDRIPLLIEAAMAFGTGHHGTTLGCLKLLDRLADEGFQPKRIADIGCGTAVLAMAATKIWPDAEVIASDIDAVAVEVSKANLIANNLEGRVACIEAVGFEHPQLRDQPFDLIFANILKGPLVSLAPDFSDSLLTQGKAILSGILTDQAPEIVNIYGQFGLNVYAREEINEWTSMILGQSGD